MTKNIFEDGWYEEYVQEKLIPDYIEGVDLSNIEWLNFNKDQLYNFLSDNYTVEIDGEKIFVGNSNENKIDGYDYTPLGLDFLNYDIDDYEDNYTIDDNYLLGVVNNKAGKKTIVSHIIYSLRDLNLYFNQTVPITKVKKVEVNSYFENPELYKQIINRFVYIVPKNLHIVMLQYKSGFDANDCLKENEVFQLLRQTAYENAFPMTVFSTDLSDDKALRNLLCQEHINPTR